MPKIITTLKKKRLSKKIISELKKNPTEDIRRASLVPGAAKKMSNLELWQLEQMFDLMKVDKDIKAFKPKEGETEKQKQARFRTLLKKKIKK